MSRPSLVVVAFPKIAEADHARIQAIRDAYDPAARMIAPHFTFIFPTDAIEPAELFHEVRIRAARIQAIEFRLRRALCVPPTLHDQDSYVFAVPDEGMSAMHALHANLHSGILATQRRKDIFFLPHLTIGRVNLVNRGYEIESEINDSGFDVRGTLDRLTLVARDGMKREPLDEIELQA